jgi:hypothetical protein
VPFNLGEEVTTKTHGLFVIPVEKLMNGECFSGIDFAIEDDSYHNVRYDYEDAPI